MITKSGLLCIEGLNVVPLDGLWATVGDAGQYEKLGAAMEYAGCDFYDESRKFVKGNVVSLVGLGGVPVAYMGEELETIDKRIQSVVFGANYMMGSSAAFSYLNSGEKEILDLYKKVVDLGHFSVGHTVQVNFLIAGISEAAELELGLQRDLVHFSKVTNARTAIQNDPPILVRDPAMIEGASRLREVITKETKKMREEMNTPGDLELINGFYPASKATVLMISGDLSNLRKFVQLENDAGKEDELREIASRLGDQLGLLWQEIFPRKKNQLADVNNGEMPKNDYFAEEMLSKLDARDPVEIAFEAQDISSRVGFDFASFTEVVDRALDEVREMKEASEEPGDEGRAHFGDEIADVMFSLVNLTRFSGNKNLPTFEELQASENKVVSSEEKSIMELVRGIEAISVIAVDTPELLSKSMNDFFGVAMHHCIKIARANSFDPEYLFRENIKKYLDRCRLIEGLALKDGKTWQDLSERGEIIDYWKRAKQTLSK